MNPSRFSPKHFLTAGAILLILSLVENNATQGQSLAQPSDSAPRAPLPAVPAPQGIPAPGPMNDQPYAPRAILQGGIVVTLFPPGSKYLKADRIREAEKYNMSKDVPGRISSIVNIHNPSIEVHLVDRSLNTGAAVILAAGGGHNTLERRLAKPRTSSRSFTTTASTPSSCATACAGTATTPRPTPFTTPSRPFAWSAPMPRNGGIDPNRIGIMGFSAGAELAAPAAIAFDDFDKANNDPRDPLAGIHFAARLRRHHLSRAHAVRARRNARPSRAMSRRRSSSAPARATRATRSGRTNTSPPCSRSACPTSKCTSTATATTPAAARPAA